MSTTAHTLEKSTDVDQPTDHDTDHVDGGTLVYRVEREYRVHLDREVTVSRSLVAFANVDDWGAIRSELIKRGHGVGTIHHLPEFTGTA